MVPEQVGRLISIGPPGVWAGRSSQLVLVLALVRHTDTQAHKHADTQAHRHTGTQTRRHTDTQAHRHTDTQAHRHTGTHT